MGRFAVPRVSKDQTVLLDRRYGSDGFAGRGTLSGIEFSVEDQQMDAWSVLRHLFDLSRMHAYVCEAMAEEL